MAKYLLRGLATVLSAMIALGCKESTSTPAATGRPEISVAASPPTANTAATAQMPKRSHSIQPAIEPTLGAADTPESSTVSEAASETNTLSFYHDKATITGLTVKNPALSSQIMASAKQMTDALAAMREHLNTAKNSKQEFGGRIYSTVPVEGGRLSFSFLPKGPDLQVKDFSRRDSENKTLFSIRFHENGQVATFMKGETAYVQYYEDGEMKSYAAIIEGKTFEAEWDQAGKLISKREQGPDGKMRPMPVVN